MNEIFQSSADACPRFMGMILLKIVIHRSLSDLKEDFVCPSDNEARYGSRKFCLRLSSPFLLPACIGEPERIEFSRIMYLKNKLAGKYQSWKQ